MADVQTRLQIKLLQKAIAAKEAKLVPINAQIAVILARGYSHTTPVARSGISGAPTNATTDRIRLEHSLRGCNLTSSVGKMMDARDRLEREIRADRAKLAALAAAS